MGRASAHEAMIYFDSETNRYALKPVFVDWFREMFDRDPKLVAADYLTSGCYILGVSEDEAALLSLWAQGSEENC